MKLDIDLLAYQDRLKIVLEDGRRMIKDPVRKRNFVLQPEEVVRQLWMVYLHEQHDISFASMAVEKQLIIGEVKRRFDLVIFKKGVPYILCEFKSHKIEISNDTAMQAAHYNASLQVPYIILSNGAYSYCYSIDQDAQTVTVMSELPM